ncbi:MAG: hypothetical protein JWN69_923 [Alphaproteobacteria bacterium]|nr:hypothetical protein [Alphaproteobacteria bacterium]
MIDNFALALSHGLLILAAWRLLSRPDLDDDGAHAPDAAGSGALLKASFLKTPFRRPKPKPEDRAGA